MTHKIKIAKPTIKNPTESQEQQVALKITDIDTHISYFVGKLIFKNTGKIKMCDICGEHPGSWIHDIKNKKGKIAYLCFICGDH